MIDIMTALRGKVTGEVFDYQVLMDALSMYSKPRDVVTRLLSEGIIIRIKKGLYCFGEVYRRRPVSREYIANLVYGPSYVSLEYAMHYHGMIPDRVHTVTSVTTKRSKEYSTHFGVFYYRMLSNDRYAIGQMLDSSVESSFLIATPEKALVDKVWTDSRFDGTRISEFEQYLVEDLRIEPETLEGLDSNLMFEICDAFGSAKIRNLIACLKKIWSTGNA
jgi:hypothetical protein